MEQLMSQAKIQQIINLAKKIGNDTSNRLLILANSVIASSQSFNNFQGTEYEEEYKKQLLADIEKQKEISKKIVDQIAELNEFSDNVCQQLQ